MHLPQIEQTHLWFFDQQPEKKNQKFFRNNNVYHMRIYESLWADFNIGNFKNKFLPKWFTKIY